MAGGAIVLAVAAAVISLCIWLWQNSKLKTTIDKIPGPPALPIIGNALEFKPGGSDFYIQIMEYCKDFSNLGHGMFRLWIGPQPALALYQADTAEVLLNTTKHMSKSPEYRFLHPWLGTGLLTSSGMKWHLRRKMLTPTFHFKILSDFLQVFNEQEKVMVSLLEKKADKGEFDIFPYITLCALDIICETAMGRSIDAQVNAHSDYVEAVYKIGELVQTRQKTPWYGPDILYGLTKDGKEHAKCLSILHEFTEKVIKERTAEVEGNNDDTVTERKRRLAFLDLLIEMSKGENYLSFLDIREEVDTFMFEGHDTTAAAANWATFFLGTHPEVQQKCHEELDEIFGDSDRNITMDDIKNMKYLECVIKEALRLYPSVPLFGRTIDEDCKIGGYDVPKGTTAIIVTSALHRDPNHFPDPEKFDPDRFLPENSVGRHPYCYVPFSAGMRNCIGQKFALNEEKTLLAAILRNFNIESKQKEEDLGPVGELILRPSHGIKVKLTKRN